jgi:doublecortin-like kinase 1/2
MSGDNSTGSVEQKARKVWLYRNGDAYYSGMMFVVTHSHHRTFDALLQDLTRSVLCDKKQMPLGVRYLFDLESRRALRSIDDIQDGGCYVCSSAAILKPIDYIGITEKKELQTRPLPRSVPFSTGIAHRTRSDVSRSASAAGSERDDVSTTEIRPRTIAVIRNCGCRPRRVVPILLNHRTAAQYQQALDTISNAVKLTSGAVRKLFTIYGRQVKKLSDLYGDDFVFMAYGASSGFNEADFELSQNEAWEAGLLDEEQQASSTDVGNCNNNSPPLPPTTLPSES